ncbi:MAG TPA: NUDIX domain-containing protein [Longimicrobiaceae bacterium]
MLRIATGSLHEILRSAKRSVRLIGVVALDPDWEDLLPRWAQAATENPEFHVLVLCESDNLLFAHSFLSDTEAAPVRREFSELRFIRDRASEDLSQMVIAQYDAASKRGTAVNQFLTVEIMYLQIPVSIVEVDGQTFASVATYTLDGHYEEISEDHPWAEVVRTYSAAYFDKQQGRKYADTPGEEVLELFDHNRIPRGIYPRRSFYDTDYSQLVVWALIFDRQGRLLIHRRSDNAKDNQSMWDKSVGGHVDFAQDVGTSRAVVREVIEELYADELKKDIGVWAPSDEEMIYLGEWRPKQRGRNPFREISSFDQEWAFFRLREYQRLYSPREMPGGRVRRLRVIADVFLFVAGSGLTDDSLGELQNSKFKLMDLSELKSVMDRALRKEEVLGFDDTRNIPLFTPDLVNIMTGELRAALTDFSQYVKRYVNGQQ